MSFVINEFYLKNSGGKDFAPPDAQTECTTMKECLLF